MARELEEKLEGNGVMESERGFCVPVGQYGESGQTLSGDQEAWGWKRNILTLAACKAVVTSPSHGGIQMDSHVAQAHVSDPVKDIIKLPKAINDKSWNTFI